MKKLAFLFPGQGSQVVGMGKELADNHAIAKQTFQEADEALGFAISQLCFEGPEDKLKLTEHTQPAILTASVAALRVLQEKGITPTWVAGHSLGEYSAHVAAGTFTFAEAVRTVRNRGKYMQEAVPAGKGAMAAVLGMDLEKLEEICFEAAAGDWVSPANINSPNQIVISGSAPAVQRAADLAKIRGAKRAILLPVSAPFHCRLMLPAQVQLAEDLRALHFNHPNVPVAMNIDGQLTVDATQSRQGLIWQVTGAVQWVRCMQTLLKSGAETFIEVGPGKVLCGLAGQIEKGTLCYNVENDASLQKTLEALAS